MLVIGLLLKELRCLYSKTRGLPETDTFYQHWWPLAQLWVV